jgi:proteic killer suppression protein
VRIEFEDEDLERLYADSDFRLASLGPDLVRQFRKAMAVIVAAADERGIRAMRSLHLEKLAGDRAGQHSIRLNKQWRLILRFRTDKDGKTVVVVAIEDYH